MELFGESIADCDWESYSEFFFSAEIVPELLLLVKFFGSCDSGCYVCGIFMNPTCELSERSPLGLGFFNILFLLRIETE